jgi:hypothetical protein
MGTEHADSHYFRSPAAAHHETEAPPPWPRSGGIGNFNRLAGFRLRKSSERAQLEQINLMMPLYFYRHQKRKRLSFRPSPDKGVERGKKRRTAPRPQNGPLVQRRPCWTGVQSKVEEGRGKSFWYENC